LTNKTPGIILKLKGEIMVEFLLILAGVAIIGGVVVAICKFGDWYLMEKC
jgi:hypothetical protein